MKNNFAKLKILIEQNVANAAPVIPYFGIKIKFKITFNTAKNINA